MSKKFSTSLGPTLDAEGRLQGEYYGELQDRADEMRQLNAVHEQALQRQADMKRRMDTLALEPEEWRWEVHKREVALRNWAERWNEQQRSINRMAMERQGMKVAILELRQELGQMASAEERNGNFKTADVLRMVTLRLKDVAQDKTE